MRLSALQRIKRRIWLLKGSFTHPDGTIELDIDEKGGVDPTVDEEETSARKLHAWRKKLAGEAQSESESVLGPG